MIMEVALVITGVLLVLWAISLNRLAHANKKLKEAGLI